MITATSFGPSRVWDTIISNPERRFRAFHVELNDKDETVLISDTKEIKEMNPDCPPEMRSDEEGNVALLVTEIRKNGEVIKNEPISRKRVIEYTYIPASSIKTIKGYFRKER